VLAELRDRGSRYQELTDALDDISHKVLTDTLRRAERDGLIVRHVDPSRIETGTLYDYAEFGVATSSPTSAGPSTIRSPRSNDGVDANWPEIEEARRRWNQRSD
jgi:hypothetical protein